MTTQEIITIVFLPLITILISGLGWFIKDRFNSLVKTDERLENKIDESNKVIGRKVEETRLAMIEMQTIFNKMGYPMQRILGVSSPLGLTEYGKKLVRESGFNQIFENNKDRILGWAKEHKPETKYDAQEVSREVLLEHKEDEIFKPLKVYAFEHWETYPEQILRAGAVVVRDEVIKELNLEK